MQQHLGGAADAELTSLALCVASIAGAAPADVPRSDEVALRAWLAERGLGLVPVDDAAAFLWAGPWIAWRPAADGAGRRAAVLFGVPPDVLFDPAGTRDEVLGGFVVAPLDVGVWSRPGFSGAVAGVVEAIVVAPLAGAPVVSVDAAEAVPGVGLAGDRYAVGAGTFHSGRPGTAITLVDAAVLDELGPIDHRRNLVVRGADVNALVGREFLVGEVRCRGSRLCEPCAHLNRLNGRDVLRPLVHRGGLRADIVSAGTIRVGDSVSAPAR